MEQPSCQQLALLPDELPGSFYCCFPHRGVSQPCGDGHSLVRGVDRLPGFGLGWRESSHHQELQKAEPHSVCDGRHGGQLHADFSPGERHDVYDSSHSTSDFDNGTRFVSPTEHEEQAPDQAGMFRAEENSDGHPTRVSGTAGRKHTKDSDFSRGKSEGVNCIFSKILQLQCSLLSFMLCERKACKPAMLSPPQGILCHSAQNLSGRSPLQRSGHLAAASHLICAAMHVVSQTAASFSKSVFNQKLLRLHLSEIVKAAQVLPFNRG